MICVPNKPVVPTCEHHCEHGFPIGQVVHSHFMISDSNSEQVKCIPNSGLIALSSDQTTSTTDIPYLTM